MGCGTFLVAEGLQFSGLKALVEGFQRLKWHVALSPRRHDCCHADRASNQEAKTQQSAFCGFLQARRAVSVILFEILQYTKEETAH